MWNGCENAMAVTLVFVLTRSSCEFDRLWQHWQVLVCNDIEKDENWEKHRFRPLELDFQNSQINFEVNVEICPVKKQGKWKRFLHLESHGNST